VLKLNIGSKKLLFKQMKRAITNFDTHRND